MRGVFDDKEQEQAQPQRDTELTLGVGTLSLMFLSFVLICGLFFGLGYEVGRRGTSFTSAAGLQPSVGAQTPLGASGSLPKPSATAAVRVAPPTQSAMPQGADSQPGAANQPQSLAAMPAAAQPASNPAASAVGQLEVRPALAQPTSVPQAGSASGVHPALPAAVQLMVQVAAVSRQEDAEVLAGALRKRGYAVSTRRDPADNLIHVRIGPFNTRDEANRWRLKLLNDGYNALIQP
ncbi:MAG TPA: SPOR domain-containing protein [Terracidiphilus sp.]|nr:SPOR domain-containing protein [Terracidiphilus sp.]